LGKSIGVMHAKNGEYLQASGFLEEALKLSRQTGDVGAQHAAARQLATTCAALSVLRLPLRANSSSAYGRQSARPATVASAASASLSAAVAVGDRSASVSAIIPERSTSASSRAGTTSWAR
jgi:hypothetical protein